MPYLPLSSRYAPAYGFPQQLSPGLLSPDAGDESSPAFDPQMAQVDQNQTQTPLPPPPSVQPPPQQNFDTVQSSQIANPPPLVPLNGTFPAGGSAKDTGAKQLLAKAQMPPPTPPPSMQPQAAPAPPEGSFPAGGFGAPSIAQPVVAGIGAASTQPQSEEEKALAGYEKQSEKLKEDHAGNESPKSNWLQRLSSALLSLTKFAPYSNQIVHPKWTEQENQYQRSQADIAQQEAQIRQNEATEAQAESRRGWAAQRKSTELLNEEKAEQLHNKPAIDAAAQQVKLLKDAQEAYDKKVTELHNDGGRILPPGAQPPAGWGQLPLTNPRTNEKEIYVQPPFLSAIQETDPALAAELVKRKYMTQDQVGIPLTSDAVKSYRAQIEKDREAEATNTSKVPNPVGLTPEAVAIRASGQNTGNPILDAMPPEAAARVQASINAPKEEGSWTLAENDEGHPIQFNSKTGAIRPVSGIQKTGTAAKAAADKEKQVGPARDALNYANDYIGNNAPTGPGDEALQEKFFELAKPSVGFRMTQPQIDMLQNSRDWMGSIEAHIRHATTGTWFNDTQRKQIVQTMQDLANAKGLGKNASAVATPQGSQIPNGGGGGGTAASTAPPIPLKDGTFMYPHDPAAAAKFRQDHANLIK